jgi:ferredoxin-NADP reductase
MKITDRFHEARIQSLQDVTPTVREFTLILPCDAPPTAFHWQAGSHIQVQLLVNAKETTRHYSLLPPLAAGTLRIAVKRVVPGRGGSAALWQLSAGNMLRVSEPHNQFPLDLNAPAYFLLAGGIGITPIYGMAQLLAQRGANVHLLYCASSGQEWAYWPDLESALGDQALAVVGPATDLQERIVRLPAHAQAYVCGPAGLLQAMQTAWSQAGRAPALLRYESFGAVSTKAETFTVLLPRHRLEFEVPPQSSLLDALEMQGIAAMYGCRKGECGLCALPVLAWQGEIDHQDVFLSQHEKQSNTHICVCVSRAKGCITLDTAYRPDVIASTTAVKKNETAPAN